MSWPVVALTCWASLLVVAVWVLRWRMTRDTQVAALVAQVDELKRQLQVASESPAAVSSTLGRFAFMRGGQP